MKTFEEIRGFSEKVKGDQLMHHGETTKHFDMCPSALKAFDKNQKDGMGDKDGFHEAVIAVDKYLGFEKMLAKKGSASDKNVNHMADLVKDAKAKISKAGLSGHTYHSIHMDKVKDLKRVEDITEEKKGLAAKAEKSGISLGVLKKVYNRGMAAWRTGHRPGTTPQQWGMARVNSFITKGSGTWGKADKDLADRVRSSKKK